LQIYESADSTNAFATFLIFVALIFVGIAVLIAPNEGSKEIEIVTASIGGGCLSLGLTFKVIAQLMFIRAALEKR
jgi:hypothetical protein